MKSLWRVLFAIWFFCALRIGHAQDQVTITASPPTATSSPPTITLALPTASPLAQSLAAALITAIPPKQRIYLTVKAESVSLPPNTVMPPNGSSLTTVTDTYNRSVRAFGSVTAIAPPTMTVLNMHPTEPDIYAGLQSEQAFKLLAASLNDPQWHALTSEDGLGLSDLNDDDQRRLFQAVFHGNSLQVSVAHPTADMPDNSRDLSSELPQVRLRLGQNIQISLPAKGQPNSSIGGATAPSSYVWTPSYTLTFGSPEGVQQSAEVPNVLKLGQLDWNLPALRVLIPLAGLKTVGDLIARVAELTHLELYADKHFEGQSLVIIGADNGSPPAADLLRTLAFCVTGAFRQVGPAYVLTDDVVGVATRRKILANFSQDVSLHLKKKLTEAGDTLVTKRSLSSLSVFGNPLALTSDQWKSVQHDAVPGSSTLETDFSMDQLTSAQQTSVQQESARLAQMAQQNPEFNIPVTDLTGKMHLQIHPRLEFLVPSLDGPVETNFAFFDLFQASNKLQRVLNKAKPAPKPITPPLTLAQSMQMAARRALLVQPHTLADLDATLDTMKRLGFNQLWLDLFSAGQMHLVPSDGSGDLLTEAIKKTRGTGIQVFAVMDLFGWDQSAPSDAVDLTVLGETSVEDDARQQQAAVDEADADGYVAPPISPAKSLVVTPLAPDVQERLITLVRSLASRPGLAGLVWRDTAPSGYLTTGDFFYNPGSSPLGYTEGARLEFLRQQHADPVDVSNESGSIILELNNMLSSIVVSGEVRTSSGGSFALTSTTGASLPNFDDYSIDRALSAAWEKYRADADVALMRTLLAAASNTRPGLKPVILVQQRRDASEEDWYGLWTNPTAPLPEWKMTTSSGGMNQIDRLAKSQSPVALLALDTDDLHGYTGLAALVHHQMLGKTWDGFALDMTLPGAPTLSSLGQPIKPTQAAK